MTLQIFQWPTFIHVGRRRMLVLNFTRIILNFLDNTFEYSRHPHFVLKIPEVIPLLALLHVHVISLFHFCLKKTILTYYKNHRVLNKTNAITCTTILFYLLYSSIILIQFSWGKLSFKLTDKSKNQLHVNGYLPFR